MNSFLNMDDLKKRTSLSIEKSKTEKQTRAVESSKNCPKCKEPMSNVKHGKILMDKCQFCHGYWLKDGQLEYLCQHLTEHQLNQLNSIGQAKEKKKSYNSLFHFDSRLSCPYCPKDLREIYFKLDHKIKLDICDRCQGVFYDSDELKIVVSMIRDANI